MSERSNICFPVGRRDTVWVQLDIALESKYADYIRIYKHAKHAS